MMVPSFSFWPLLVAILHSTTVSAEVAFVRPNSSVSCASSSQQPCLTFNEYAQQVDRYFVDKTTFIFLPGTHQLDFQLDLKDLSNIAFVPFGEGSNDTAKLLLSPLANITWTNCKNVELHGLVFILSGNFSVVSKIDDLFSAELIFQETSAISY